MTDQKMMYLIALNQKYFSMNFLKCKKGIEVTMYLDTILYLTRHIKKIIFCQSSLKGNKTKGQKLARGFFLHMQ